MCRRSKTKIPKTKILRPRAPTGTFGHPCGGARSVAHPAAERSPSLPHGACLPPPRTMASVSCQTKPQGHAASNSSTRQANTPPQRSRAASQCAPTQAAATAPPKDTSPRKRRQDAWDTASTASSTATNAGPSLRLASQANAPRRLASSPSPARKTRTWMR